MSEKTKDIITIISVYCGSILLALILAPVGGALHRFFWEFKGCDIFIGLCDERAVTEGFVYFYIFLLAIFSFAIFIQKKAWKVYLIGTFLFWLLSILFIITDFDKYALQDNIGFLILMLCLLAVGYGIGIGIKKLIKNKN
ncbi:MAG: hypothetical protein ABH881_02955 [bacterium]